MTNEIQNIALYTNRMRKSLLDKLFFLDKTYDPITAVVDFGCADGALIKAMQVFFPEYTYLGYDNNKEMVKRARAQNKEAFFFSDWERVLAMLDNLAQRNQALLNVSSCVHEVYSYGSPPDIEQFWERVFSSGFEYVAIRDMVRPSITNAHIPDENISVLKSEFPTQTYDFEGQYGSLSEPVNFAHFMLKYPYEDNWHRELLEDYFAVSAKNIMTRAHYTGIYEIVYSEEYTLPYIKQRIKSDFGFDFNIPTHFKVLFKRK